MKTKYENQHVQKLFVEKNECIKITNFKEENEFFYKDLKNKNFKDKNT
jgi:hypothetical protein